MTTNHKALLVFTAAYIVVFGAYYAQALNFEFIGYLGVLVGGFALIYKTLPRTQFPLYILWGLSIWGLLHMAGGSIKIGDGVLYAYRIIDLYDGGGEFFILKMDQLIHAFGFGVAALTILHLLSKSALGGISRFWLSATSAFVSMGLGALNEVIEFLAVVLVADTGVGGYYNIALDLVFNLAGAIVAVALVHFLSNTASDGTPNG